MTEFSAEQLDQLCRKRLPSASGLQVRCAVIEDHSNDLYDQERLEIRKAIAKRQHEFSTGRWLARQTMADLGIATGPIGRGEQRQPLWPEDSVGSITHTEQIACVAVGVADSVRSVGIDLESWARVGPELHRKLLTASEIAALPNQPECAAGLIFSAKEAGYKATYPLAERFIGFQEAEIDINWRQCTFAIRYVGENSENAVMEQGRGHFLVAGGFALSLFVIP